MARRPIMKLLIAGDSFSTDDGADSWANQLGCPTVNISVRGVSEYRIYQKIKNCDFSQYDFAIVCHTSSTRIHIPKNPYYDNHSTHPECDLLYADMRSRLPDQFAKNVVWWFENVFDTESADFVHELIVEKIKSIIPIPCLHITFFKSQIPNVLNLSHIWKSNSGKINHLNKTGNQLITKLITDYVYNNDIKLPTPNNGEMDK